MDASQFKQLFLPCHRKLFAIARRLDGSGEQAEDMVQETYLRLWTQRNYIGSPDNPEAYAATVLRRIFYDRMRSSRLPESDTDVGNLRIVSDQDAERDIETADECRMIRRMIASLPEPQCRIMMMRDVEERSYGEISDETGLTEVNVRSILSRARKKIREQIKVMRHEGN